jgi:phage terminase small subunit
MRQIQTEADNLTARQRAFVAAMLTARTMTDAAAAVKVSTRTAQRWARLPPVQVALRDAQAEALDQAARRTVAALTMALDVLIDTMQNAPAKYGTPAARTVLDFYVKLARIADLSQRVEALEAQAGTDELTKGW